MQEPVIYALGPDAQIDPSVPKGELKKYEMVSRIYSGIPHDYWVYVPAQYNSASPACVMFFQDGGS